MEEAQFWSKVDKSGDCWLWLGGHGSQGYGMLWIVGDQGRKRVWAHRWAYQLTNGPIPPGMFVCHSCDNPPCVNPAHLWLGTNLDNMRDAQKKGRFNNIIDWKHAHPEFSPNITYHCGEGHKAARLTAKQVEEIRRRYAAGGISYAKLASKYGVVASTVALIIRGETWQRPSGEKKRFAERRASEGEGA